MSACFNDPRFAGGIHSRLSALGIAQEIPGASFTSFSALQRPYSLLGAIVPPLCLLHFPTSQTVKSAPGCVKNAASQISSPINAPASYVRLYLDKKAVRFKFERKRRLSQKHKFGLMNSGIDFLFSIGSLLLPNFKLKVFDQDKCLLLKSV